MLFRKSKESIVKKPPIGEVYCGKYLHGNWGLFQANLNPSYLQWIKFTEDNICRWKNHDGYIHIFGECFPKEDVLFYDEVAYGDFRASVEKRHLKSRQKDGRKVGDR